MTTLDKLITYPTLIINGVVYPVVYEWDNGRTKWYYSNDKIGLMNVKNQWDIDRLILSAYIAIHRGDTIE